MTFPPHYHAPLVLAQLSLRQCPICDIWMARRSSVGRSTVMSPLRNARSFPSMDPVAVNKHASKRWAERRRAADALASTNT